MCLWDLEDSNSKLNIPQVGPIGVQTVHSKTKTLGKRYVILVGGTPHSLGTPDMEKAFNRIEIKWN